jgi:Asp-tRNA(Asn)/Glu-tRNA(Gln) amidotransferase B subunit
VAERDLGKLDDRAALTATVREVLDAHPDEVAAYRGGKTGLIGFFVGQAMRATGGRADPKAVRAALEEALAERG